ncbi:hypothetical protein [Luteipulveratus halotolerans]|uniref:hypothetical protein n=1 Tax=Luteipulveratus halotolerans TaxID=1631356 RepID=UPI0006823812|nr:hypothetical protein [Luteipulveratus halotolerans]
MSIFVMTSATGSPGVTTTAVAWAMQSGAPGALLVEADATGGSPVLAGAFRSRWAHTSSVLSLAMRPAGLSLIEHIQAQAMPIPGSDTAHVLPAVAEPDQAGALANLWDPLAAALRRISDGTDQDIFIDLGRWSSKTAPQPLLRVADAVAVFTWAHLPGINTTSIVLPSIRARIGEVGETTKVAVVAVEPPREGFSVTEIAPPFQPSPVVARIPHRPTDAAVYHLGAKAPNKRRFASYVGSVTHALDAMREHEQSYRDDLGVGA